MTARRDNAELKWRHAADHMNSHPTAETVRAAQAAMDELLDICNDLEQCIAPSCRNHSPDHVYCEEHR